MAKPRFATPPDENSPEDDGYVQPEQDSRLSPQQQAVVEWVRSGRGSAFVEARAGSGKTTVGVEACRHMSGYVAFAAFNKKIADEIKTKIGNQPNVRAGTFHSFGLGAWKRIAPSVLIDAELKRKLMMEAAEVSFALRPAIGKMTSIAKQANIGIDWEIRDRQGWLGIIDHHDILLSVDEANDRNEDRVVDKLIDLAIRCVEWCAELKNGSKVIDFDDMIWLPLLHNAPFFQQDWVIVDEAQDTNPARRLMAQRMMKRNGRSMWIGDRHQAIYGFTGASADAVDRIIQDFECCMLPLTVTFRCSHAATALAQTWVPDITAFHKNEPGSVSRMLTAQAFETRYVTGEMPYDPARLRPGDAILCRNTKPLVSLAFDLIRAGIGCHVEGRDIGKSLEQMATKWKVITTKELSTKLESYRSREMGRLMQKEGTEYQIEQLNDRIDTLLIIMEDCDTVEQVRTKIQAMFQDSNGGSARTVILSTVHKAKGREWDRVFILGYAKYMPSKYARQQWQIVQEHNLLYVAVTRTKRDLILLPVLEGR